jgi:hypothetical protein
MMIIGIDPGKNGAIVFLQEDGKVAVKHKMPTIGKVLDINALKGILSIPYLDVHVFIEDVHAIYGSAAGATFEFGFVCGAIQGVVTALGLKHTLVQPKRWQKEIYQGIPEIRKPPITILKGKRTGQTIKGKLDTKKMSELAAKRLFPDVDLRASERCKIPHDGIVDALLIAEYGRRLLRRT